jgi:hypothetical protein
VVVSLSKGLRSLSEHRGGDDSTHSGQGKDDSHVAMLAILPRLAHLIENRLNPGSHIGPLLLQESNPGKLQKHVLTGGLHCSWCQLQWRNSERGEYVVCAQAADVLLFKKAFDFGCL